MFSYQEQQVSAAGGQDPDCNMRSVKLWVEVLCLCLTRQPLGTSWEITSTVCTVSTSNTLDRNS